MDDSKRWLRLKILGEHVYSDGYNTLEEYTDGVYGDLCDAVDRGEPTMGLIDAICLEDDLVCLDDDEVVRAAVSLALLGWRPEQLGGLFNQRLARGRTGRRLLEDGIRRLSVVRKQRMVGGVS